MALASWPVPPANWVLPWAIWRFKGHTTNPKPPGVPATVPKYAWEFLTWAAWRRKGAKPPRPDVTPRIPQWGWNYLKQINIAVPLVPPPPPPPPPLTYVNSWTLPSPLMYTTWGWMNEPQFRDSNEGLEWIVNVCKAKTIALQIGQYADNVPDRCRAYGLKVCLWGSPDAQDNIALQRAEADGYMPQIEGPYEYQRTRDNLAAGYGEGRSLAIVTTLSGLDTWSFRPDGQQTTVEMETLISYGCTHAWVECYKQGGPSHFPISKMEFSATQQRGIPYFSPLIGLYWDVDVDEYQPEVAEYGKRVGAYTAETMRPIDRVKFGALGT